MRSFTLSFVDFLLKNIVVVIVLLQSVLHLHVVAVKSSYLVSHARLECRGLRASSISHATSPSPSPPASSQLGPVQSISSLSGASSLFFSLSAIFASLGFSFVLPLVPLFSLLFYFNGFAESLGWPEVVFPSLCSVLSMFVSLLSVVMSMCCIVCVLHPAPALLFMLLLVQAPFPRIIQCFFRPVCSAWRWLSWRYSSWFPRGLWCVHTTYPCDCF